jgi:hypothetical protein
MKKTKSFKHKLSVYAFSIVSTASLASAVMLYAPATLNHTVNAAMTSESLVSQPTTTNFTITGVESTATVKLYKVAEVNLHDYADQTYAFTDPQYTWVSPLRATVKSINSTYIKDSDGSVTSTFKDTLSDTGGVNTGTATPKNAGTAEFYDKLTKAITSSNLVTEKSVTLTKANNNVTFSMPSTDKGIYLVTMTGGDRVYRSVVINYAPTDDQTGDNAKLTFPSTMTVAAKSTEMPVTKTANKQTMSNASEVNYTVTQKTPVYPANAINKKFVIKDVLPDGMSLKANSLVIKNDSGSVTLVKDTDYTVTEAKEGSKNTFTVSFLPAAFNKDIQSVKLTYTGVLAGANAATYKDITNNVTTTYTVNPYSTDTSFDKTKTTNVTVHSYGIDLTKLGTGNAKLANAVFEVYDSSNQKLSFVDNGNGSYTLMTDALKGSNNLTTTVTSPTSGLIKIYGLDLGKYTLKEVKAPKGYTLANPVEVTIADSDKNGVLDGDTDNLANLSITNVEEFELPGTGSQQLTVLIVAGALCIVCGAVLTKRVHKDEA